MLRLLVVGSNLGALPVIWEACWPVSVALSLAMVASMVFHATVGPEVTTMWDRTLRNGLEDDGLLWVFTNSSFGRRCREHSREWLLLDQVFAVVAMVVTIAYYGFPRFRPSVFALLVLALSDMTDGISHAILHSVWHSLAFAIAGELVRKKKTE